MATGIKKRTFKFEWSEHEDLQVREVVPLPNPEPTVHKVYVQIHVYAIKGQGTVYNWAFLMKDLEQVSQQSVSP